MPYLEVTKNNQDTETQSIQVEMPDLTGISLKEAKQTLKDLGLEYEIDTEDTEAIITNQLPKKGIQVLKGSKVILYSN